MNVFVLCEAKTTNKAGFSATGRRKSGLHRIIRFDR